MLSDTNNLQVLWDAWFHNTMRGWCGQASTMLSQLLTLWCAMINAVKGVVTSITSVLLPAGLKSISKKPIGDSWDDRRQPSMGLLRTMRILGLRLGKARELLVVEFVDFCITLVYFIMKHMSMLETWGIVSSVHGWECLYDWLASYY